MGRSLQENGVEILLSTHPLFLRRVQTFALKQKQNQQFSDYVHQHCKDFSLAKIQAMGSEDIHLHLNLGGIQGGKFRDKLFSEKSLSMKRLMEITTLYEEAEIKKNNNVHHKAKKASGQGDKKQN